jgi:hypothetical protein
MNADWILQSLGSRRYGAPSTLSPVLHEQHLRFVPSDDKARRATICGAVFRCVVVHDLAASPAEN